MLPHTLALPGAEQSPADDRNGYFVPTPEEIKAACAQIQATWSPRERRIRAGLAFRQERNTDGTRNVVNAKITVVRWEAPVCRMRGMGVSR